MLDPIQPRGPQSLPTAEPVIPLRPVVEELRALSAPERRTLFADLFAVLWGELRSVADDGLRVLADLVLTATASGPVAVRLAGRLSAALLDFAADRIDGAGAGPTTPDPA